MFSVALSGTAFPKASAKLQPFLPASKYFSDFNMNLTFGELLETVPKHVTICKCEHLHSPINFRASGSDYFQKNVDFYMADISAHYNIAKEATREGSQLR